MKIRQILSIAFFGFVFSLNAFGQAEPPRTRVSLYGIQSLVFGQSLRVAVQNSKFSETEIVPDTSVRVFFDLYEASATNPTRLRLVRRITREATLAAGDGSVFEIRAPREGSLVSVSIFATCADLVSCDGSVRVASTLNVREGGRTILNLPAVEKGFDPQPDPPTEP